MIEWVILGLVVAAMVLLLRGNNRQTTLQQYCDLECKDCEGCRH